MTSIQAFEPQSAFWKQVYSPEVHTVGKVMLYEAGARAGWGPFQLPRNHWLNNAAQPHDAWYNAAERGEIERTPENKARADTEFLIVALIDARHIAKHGTDEIQDYKEYAHLCSEACAAYLAIRSPIGEAAWLT